LEYKRSWIQHVTRMPRNSYPGQWIATPQLAEGIMVELWRDFWIRETGTGQQVPQLHERYMMMIVIIIIIIIIHMYLDTTVEKTAISFVCSDWYLHISHMLTVAIVCGLLLEFSLLRTYIYQNICVVEKLWYCIEPGVSSRTEIRLFFLYVVKCLSRRKFLWASVHFRCKTLLETWKRQWEFWMPCANWFCIKLFYVFQVQICGSYLTAVTW